MNEASGPHLRRGWTTGTCATAAARAAFEALLSGEFPDPVAVALPRGGRPAFALAMHERGDGFARAGIVKDAGDDPDVTHGALIVATVRLAPPGSGISFKAGEGVGTVTRAGLPIPPGEPAINPVPRTMMRQAIGEAAAALGVGTDVEIEISIPGGEELAKRTLNGRLGIVGGLSILGTTGIVVPFSCAAWIATIQRGIDVARAEGLDHIAGATGATSEEAVRNLDRLSEIALIDMGDFVGGMLKYVRSHPVRRVTIAGGFAKMTKLAQGLLDLHSKRGEIDRVRLAEFVAAAGGNEAMIESVAGANTALEVLERSRAAGLDVAAPVADAAWKTAAGVLQRDDILLDTAIFDRRGALLARTQAKPALIRSSAP
jgi:cobalt-precorrin-5B (C1)-methyltransferase